MQIDDILSQFDHSIGRFPRTAVREAVARREDLTPALLGVLEDAARDPRPFASEDRMVHIFAMYLLAQFRETRAYPLLVKIFSAPAESIHDLAGDVVTEGLGSILASVSGGDIGGMGDKAVRRHARRPGESSSKRVEERRTELGKNGSTRALMPP